MPKWLSSYASIRIGVEGCIDECNEQCSSRTRSTITALTCYRSKLKINSLLQHIRVRGGYSLTVHTIHWDQLNCTYNSWIRPTSCSLCTRCISSTALYSRRKRKPDQTLELPREGDQHIYILFSNTILLVSICDANLYKHSYSSILHSVWPSFAIKCAIGNEKEMRSLPGFL